MLDRPAFTRFALALAVMAFAAGVFTATPARAAEVNYVLEGYFPPGEAKSNGFYSNIYGNRMAHCCNNLPMGLYQRYTNGSRTRIVSDVTRILEVFVPSAPIYTQAWCQNPSGPGGTAWGGGGCKLTNTA